MGGTLRGWRLEEGDFQGGTWGGEAITGLLHIYCKLHASNEHITTFHNAMCCRMGY